MIADRIPLFGPGLQRLTHLGLDIDQILYGTGIPLAAFQQSKVLLTTRQYFSLWEAIEKASRDEQIGLRIGGEARVDQFDPASFAALHSRTFGEALERLSRYKRLSCPEVIHLEPDGAVTSIRIRWLYAKGLAPNALTDAAFANIRLLLSCGTGKVIAPLRIERTQLRGEIQRYSDYFGCEVRTGTMHDALVYSRDALDERFVTNNQDLIAALLPGLDMQLNVALPLSFDEQVKAVLTRMMHGERPSINAVARHMCLSPRTLQRRLTDAQTSYQNILDSVRQNTACKLLAQTDMGPGEIAFYLGFEEANSFLRAFHQWLGMTPTQWRLRYTSSQTT